MSGPSSDQVAVVVDALTTDFLSAALGARVSGVRAERVGTGQIGACFRLHLTGDGVPPTVVAKLPSADLAAREMMAGVYRGELRFYSEVASTVAIRVPECLYAAGDPDRAGDVTLLLEDLAPRVQGDQVVGCTPAQARDAAINLAGLHGPRWCDATLLDIDGLSLNGPDDAALLAQLYGPAVDLFVEGLGDLVSAEDGALLLECVTVTPAWTVARSERFGLVHGDYRLDNLLFPPDGADGVVAVDWQTLSLALPARDLAYLLGTGLSVDDRRTHERALVEDYRTALLTHGVAGYDAETCWDDYRFAMLQGPLVSVFGCAYGTRTERGDAMFAAMVARSCAAIRDLRSLELVTFQEKSAIVTGGGSGTRATPTSFATQVLEAVGENRAMLVTPRSARIAWRVGRWGPGFTRRAATEFVQKQRRIHKEHA